MTRGVIRFGTDGWRGIIAQDFTFDGVRACAQSVAEYVKDNGLAGRGLTVGYDTRFGSEAFAAAAAEVVAANGIKVYLCPQPTPTPVISYDVAYRHRGAAIIITASHNPGQWNGFKVKDSAGASGSGEMLADMERRLDHILAQGRIEHMPLKEALGQGAVIYHNIKPSYMRHVSQLVDLDAIRGAGLHVAIDSMYGAGAGYYRGFLEGGNLRLTELNARRNPLFPGIRQPEPIALNLGKLSRFVVRTGADVGLATDGDADRLGVVDEGGNFIDQLQTYALLALYLLEVRGERGPIIKTVTTTSMLYRLGELYGVPVHETPVGFKYVGPLMVAHKAMIGGEESGGYGFRGHIPERDGILAGLYFLDMMVKLGRKPSELVEYLYSKVGPHHYRRVDIEFPEGKRQAILKRLRGSQPPSLASLKVVGQDTVDGFRYHLEGGFWLLIRFSGTEPLLRIYSEADSPQRAQELLDLGREVVGI